MSSIETALLLVTLASGYFYATVCPPSAYAASRESGHNIYFRSVFYASFLAFCSVIIVSALYCRNPALFPLINIPESSKHRKSTIILSLCDSEQFRNWVYTASLGLSVTVSCLIKGLLRVIPFAENWLISGHLKRNELEVLLYRAQKRQHPLLVTLCTGKVYVGWVVQAPYPQFERKYLTVLPLLSGYRDPTTHKVEFITNYYNVLEAIENKNDPTICYMRTDEMEVVIPIEQVSSAHLFDLAVHAKFSENRAYDPTNQGTP